VHTDALGTPVAVTSASRTVLTCNEYEPYGQVLAGGIADRPGYAGHVADAQTGMDYMQQRYYDPMIGGFLSADPVTAYSNPVVSFNRYRYANDNPYKFTDPDGRAGCFTGTRISCSSMLGAVKSAAIKAVANAVSKTLQALPSAIKAGVQSHLSNNTYSAQAGVSGTIAAPIRDKVPMGGSIGVTGAVNLSVNTHGQVAVTGSAAPLVGQGGGAAVGVAYGLTKSQGGASETGFAVSTNHHAEADFSVRPYPVSVGLSYDWSDHGSSFSAGSGKYSAGTIIFAGAGEQVNLTYTVNDGVSNGN
jgi:RHS repeat-associated protein